MFYYGKEDMQGMQTKTLQNGNASIFETNISIETSMEIRPFSRPQTSMSGLRTLALDSIMQ